MRSPPAIAPISAAAAGSQIRIESIATRSALEQEVEADAGDAEHHQRGVDAQQPVLRCRARAPSRRARGRSCRRPATPLTTTRSKVFWAKRPNHAPGRTTSASISSSKYHLCSNSDVSGAKRARDRRRQRRPRDPDVVGERDAADADHGAEHRGRARAAPSEGWTTIVESRERRREEVVEPARRLAGSRRCRRRSPAARAPPIAARIGQRALGDRVVGAGEADVGVLDLAVGRVGRLLGVEEVAVLDQLDAPPGRARRGTRGRSSGTCRARSAARRGSRRRRAPSTSRRARRANSRIESFEK